MFKQDFKEKGQSQIKLIQDSKENTSRYAQLEVKWTKQFQTKHRFKLLFYSQTRNRPLRVLTDPPPLETAVWFSIYSTVH